MSLPLANDLLYFGHSLDHIQASPNYLDLAREAEQNSA
jgi:hypothetical protein